MAGEKRRARLRALLKTAGVPDLDPVRVDHAFVHASAGSERSVASNERLEFFGDAILGFLASRWLMKKHADASEGLLTRRKANLVSGTACAQTALRLGFADLVVLGAGMDRDGGARNESILADAFEAFLAALHDASDLERVAAFLEKEHFGPLDRSDLGERDAKTDLQEFAQAALRITPMYFERGEGPPHERRYTSQVRVGDEILGEGIGGSKKAAQLSAAAMALSALRQRHPDALRVAEASAKATSKDDRRVIAFDKRRRPRTPRKPDPGASV